VVQELLLLPLVALVVAGMVVRRLMTASTVRTDLAAVGVAQGRRLAASFRKAVVTAAPARLS